MQLCGFVLGKKTSFLVHLRKLRHLEIRVSFILLSPFTAKQMLSWSLADIWFQSELSWEIHPALTDDLTWNPVYYYFTLVNSGPSDSIINNELIKVKMCRLMVKYVGSDVVFVLITLMKLTDEDCCGAEAGFRICWSAASSEQIVDFNYSNDTLRQ